MSQRIYVNRDQELGLFDDVVAGRRAERILLLEGASGTGKSTLLDEFRKRCGGLQWVLVNFKGMNYGPMEFLGEAADTLEQAGLAFTSFHAACVQLAAGAVVTITGNRLIGSHVDVALGALDDSQRQAQRATLTDAFFADLRQRQAQVIIAIDTFEQAIADVQSWLRGAFLQRARRTPGVIIVIAGQSVPQLDREWDECCCHCHLTGLQAEHWQEYARRKNIPLSSETVSAFCACFNGLPGEMEKLEQTARKLGGGR